MKVAFRVDASLEMGTGHVMRCMTLANALLERGAQCHFLCREHPGHLMDLISKRGHEVHPLPLSKQPDSDSGLAHAQWLGANWDEDARDSAEILEALNPHWLVVDHYALDARWEKQTTPTGTRTMVIDDLADRDHVCDLLLDQNWFADATQQRYQNRVPLRCQCFLGPAYALLKPEYKELRQSSPPRSGQVRKVMVFLGGSDPCNQTARVVKALTTPDLQSLSLEVVVGPNHPDPEGIEQLAQSRGNACCHKKLPSLAPLMAESDLMIGAGGSTTWERMCLGLPAIVISIARNQTNTNKALMKAGYIHFLGEMETVREGDITSAVRHCLANPKALTQQSRLCQDLVSGKGTDTLCDQLFSHAGKP